MSCRYLFGHGTLCDGGVRTGRRMWALKEVRGRLKSVGLTHEAASERYGSAGPVIINR